MATESAQLDNRSLLAAAALPAGVAAGESAASLPHISIDAGRLARAWRGVLAYPRAAHYALGTLIVGALAVVLFATAGPSVLVPQSGQVFPSWEAGPLHAVLGPLASSLSGAKNALDIGFSAVIVLMTLAYFVLLGSARSLSTRAIVLGVIALHAILVLSPPLQLTDTFNYLGYARLGALHHLNPYNHVIAQELHDPVYRFATWYHLPSPYGPLFTLASYPLALLPLGAAYWALKLLTVGFSLAFVALVWKCARLLGRDPRFATLFVAANPIYLMYAVAGFHNDVFMLVPSTAAIALLLARRDRSAGAALALAIGVKFTAGLLLPFLLLAARPARRRLNLFAGVALGAVPLLAIHLAVFGATLPNLADQSTLLTPWSAPNVLGAILGVGGGTPVLLRLATVALVVAVALLLRRRREWLSGAGWATLALIASLAWLVPWYLIWMLPLAALGSSLRLRRAALALTAYLVFAFVPVTGMLLSAHGIDLMRGSAGQASKQLQKKLEQ